jgi:predicted nuclease of predicted toxin-antitoxin system
MSKFKIDENLPIEVAKLLVGAGFDALTVVDQHLGGKSDEIIADVSRAEGRALVTLDLGFADIRTYPPSDYPGLIVLRPRRADRTNILSAVNRLLPLLTAEDVTQKLWIVDESGVRIRS